LGLTFEVLWDMSAEIRCTQLGRPREKFEFFWELCTELQQKARNGKLFN